MDRMIFRMIGQGVEAVHVKENAGITETLHIRYTILQFIKEIIIMKLEITLRTFTHMIQIM